MAWGQMTALAPLAALALLASGCTAQLWEEGRFARIHQPAPEPDLRLYYSSQKKDVLVVFAEATEENSAVRPRAYWLEANARRIASTGKPRFVSLAQAQGLAAIPLVESGAEAPPAGTEGLYGIVSTNGESFALYSGKAKRFEQKLPLYYGGSSRRVAQVLLTPFALAIDATIVGAVIAYYYGPEIARGYMADHH